MGAGVCRRKREVTGGLNLQNEPIVGNLIPMLFCKERQLRECGFALVGDVRRKGARVGMQYA